MSYDAETMAKIAEQLYEFQVDAAHGADGTAALRDVLRLVRQVFLYRSPDSFPQGLTIFRALEGDVDLIDRADSVIIDRASDFPEHHDGAVVQILDAKIRVWTPHSVNATELASNAVVYVFDAAAQNALGEPETIVLPNAPVAVKNPVGYPSAFAPPTFWNLEDALDFYAGFAARSTCKILRKVWASDAEDRRLVLVNHPEVIMRESLAQHLRSTVRDAKRVLVLEEQNVSETEPVDIQVSWSLTSQIALIEVKWLGRCLNDTGDDLASYTYADARAREGATQLRGYLDEFRERTPGHEVKGYLVVFDARRRGVTSWEPTSVSNQQAWSYRDQEIEFRDSVPAREDFRPPRRVYLEPRLAA